MQAASPGDKGPSVSSEEGPARRLGGQGERCKRGRCPQRVGLGPCPCLTEPTVLPPGRPWHCFGQCPRRRPPPLYLPPSLAGQSPSRERALGGRAETPPILASARLRSGLWAGSISPAKGLLPWTEGGPGRDGSSSSSLGESNSPLPNTSSSLAPWQIPDLSTGFSWGGWGLAVGGHQPPHAHKGLAGVSRTSFLAHIWPSADHLATSWPGCSSSLPPSFIPEPSQEAGQKVQCLNFAAAAAAAAGCRGGGEGRLCVALRNWFGTASFAESPRLPHLCQWLQGSGPPWWSACCSCSCLMVQTLPLLLLLLLLLGAEEEQKEESAWLSGIGSEPRPSRNTLGFLISARGSKDEDLPGGQPGAPAHGSWSRLRHCCCCCWVQRRSRRKSLRGSPELVRNRVLRGIPSASSSLPEAPRMRTSLVVSLVLLLMAHGPDFATAAAAAGCRGGAEGRVCVALRNWFGTVSFVESPRLPHLCQRLQGSRPPWWSAWCSCSWLMAQTWPLLLLLGAEEEQKEGSAWLSGIGSELRPSRNPLGFLISARGSKDQDLPGGQPGAPAHGRCLPTPDASSPWLQFQDGINPQGRIRQRSRDLLPTVAPITSNSCCDNYIRRHLPMWYLKSFEYTGEHCPTLAVVREEK
ncbi:uncharacterized protein LOC128351739 isoform X2 [Hemicordylus capensis]|uniref:uncharacterized protein LOC128346408 isoform X2 n=1 Tax=Hemicordylus capensis TaxID=884348 RepID=UPI0023035FC3|nr:uncharacterized protein LOC128346408 isoform X2 [Hemicordylus capensis]XP_053167500.1 uncharacterized protein LOC128351739 isoform X2 [Hemicordylus capensis]